MTEPTLTEVDLEAIARRLEADARDREAMSDREAENSVKFVLKGMASSYRRAARIVREAVK